jgi:outer membrane protein
MDMLRITTERKRGKILLRIEGRLAGGSITSLQECWRELKAGSPEQKFFLDLCAVSFIDQAGKVLLKDIHEQGGRLVAEGCLNQAIVREISGDGEKSTHGRRRGGRGRKGTHILFYGFLLFAFLVPGAFAAQQSAVPDSDGVLRLTLEQAVGLALKENTTVQIAVLSAAQSEQGKNIARSALLPQVELGASDSARRINLETSFGKRVPGFPQHTGPFEVFDAGPSFGARIFDLTLWRRYQAAKNAAAGARASSLSTREQVILLVVSQYLGTLRAVANVKASESRVELAQALYQQASDIQKAGVGTGIDTLRANVELQNEKQRLIEAQAERETSLYALSRLLNLDPQQKIELADSLGFFDTPQPEVEASVEQAIAARPEWKSLESQIRAADNNRKAASDERLPSLRFDGNWAYQGISAGTGIPTYNYQASVRLPLFTGGRIHAEIVNADLEIKKLREEQADLRNRIALDVKTALINLHSARNEVEVATLGMKLAGEEVEQARDRFKAGIANNIEVISAQDSLARANDNQITALYRFNQARADFARAIGQMEKLYAK